ncbi:MAG: putative membrane protein [Crocinitomix sp.]|jgi:uncharacterized membrane protein
MTKYFKYFYIVFGLTFVGYILARSILMDITYDEAWTIDAFVGLPVIDIISFSPPQVNNHMTNTLLIKLFYQFGNESVFIARLPNVIAGVFYLFFSYRISKEFFRPIFGLSLFILLISNPFILDFFSLARGYGLALAFCIGSIYYLIRFIEEHKIKAAYFSLILGSLSVLSSFSFLFYFAGLLFISHYSYYQNRVLKPQIFQLTKGTLIILIVLGALLFKPLTKLISIGELSYGGDINFYKDTLSSLVSSAINNYDITITSIILNCFLILLLLIMAFSLMKGNEKISFWSSQKWKLIILLVLPIIATSISNYLFGTKYLINRTALFFYPLIMLVLVQLANDIYTKAIRQIAAVSLAILSIFSLINCANYWNFHTSTTWFHDAHTSEILTKLNTIGIDQNKLIKLDADWPFKSSILYYTKRNVYEHVVFVEDEPTNLDSSNADYFLHLIRPLAHYGYVTDTKSIMRYQRDTLLYFEKEGIILLSNTVK